MFDFLVDKARIFIEQLTPCLITAKVILTVDKRCIESLRLESVSVMTAQVDWRIAAYASTGQTRPH